jgi:hypothetical protein
MASGISATSPAARRAAQTKQGTSPETAADVGLPGYAPDESIVLIGTKRSAMP